MTAEQPMTPAEAEAVMDRVMAELWPEVRRAMLILAATSAFVGAMSALIFLPFLLAAAT